jgi:alkaline phosphatase D
MHAAYPFVSVWDDHEVEDNYAGKGPDSKPTPPGFENNGVTPRRVPFAQRRQNGYDAFFEAMPRIRLTGSKRNRTYGTIHLNGLADLIVTDQRQYRSPQPCGDALARPCPEGADPGRTMLGAAQKAWFKDALAKDGAAWKLWASEVMLMAWDSAPGVPLNQDGWDGYAAERTEILTHVKDRGIKNLVALTGDIHTYVAGTLTTTGRITGTPVGTEFVGGSVSSLGLEAVFGPATPLVGALQATNPHIAYLDSVHRGYMVVEATKGQLAVRFRSPASTQVPHSPVSTLASFTVANGSTSVHRA